jgi:hypothetical protein
LAIPVVLLDKQGLLAHRDLLGLPVPLANLACLVFLVFRVFLV